MRRPMLLLAVVLFALLIVMVVLLRAYERPAKCQDASFEGTAGVNCR